MVLGWIWQTGTFSPCPCQISPLLAAAPLPTCSSMRSFIGALFKVLLKCIPGYASPIAPLEDSIKGLQGQCIEWTEELTSYFTQCKKALQSPTTFTIPKPSDCLVITTVDASPVNSGLGETPFIRHDSGRSVAGFFSFKLEEHQRNWLPCELECHTLMSHFHTSKVHPTNLVMTSQQLQQQLLLNMCLRSINNRISGSIGDSIRHL